MTLELEQMPINVNVQVYSRPRNEAPWDDLGRWDLEGEVHNLVVTSGKVLVARMLMEEAGFDTGITYCDVGTNNTAPTIADTDLNTGTKRNAITRTIRTGNAVQFRTFYAAADITAYLKEVGLFGHSTASSSLGTGEMFNRAIIDFDNTAGSKDLTVVVQVTVG